MSGVSAAEPFVLYPAIDIRGGRCVRLYQGDYTQETVYNADPVSVAVEFASAGVEWIHVVDLDAARTGEATNLGVISDIVAAVGDRVRVQAGGGVRSPAAARRLADAGVARVVVGTAAVEAPGDVAPMAEMVDVAVGFDVRGTEVAVRGWTSGSGVELGDALDRVADAGATAVIVTQIARDGTMAGPDIDGLRATLGLTDLAVIASGGVATAHDVAALAHVVGSGGSLLQGVIVGRAIYEGRVSVVEAVNACAR